MLWFWKILEVMAVFAPSCHKQLISKTKEVCDRGNNDKRKYFSKRSILRELRFTLGGKWERRNELMNGNGDISRNIEQHS